jgi:hypothetical protein
MEDSTLAWSQLWEVTECAISIVGWRAPNLDRFTRNGVTGCEIVEII